FILSPVGEGKVPSVPEVAEKWASPVVQVEPSQQPTSSSSAYRESSSSSRSFFDSVVLVLV
ncbi:hypothetical protein A2U01_0094439, partial [Trifolium medium]|nr:hypothetical protein [Trifolium medium]